MTTLLQGRIIQAAPDWAARLSALEEAISIAQSHDDMAPIVKRLTAHMRRVFNLQKTDFLRRFAKLRTLAEVASILGWEEAIREEDWGPIWDETVLKSLEMFKGPLEKAVQDSVDAGIRQGIADLNLSFTFNLSNPRAVSYLDHHAADRVAQINAETRRGIARIIQEGADEGRTYQQMAKDIRDRFDGFSGKSPIAHIRDRAELVAVTEVGDGYEEGNREVALGLNDRGLPMEKKWVDVGDARVDANCRGNTGAGWIGINDHFPTGHMRPLEHPGCRCHVQYRRKSTANTIHTAPPVGDTPPPVKPKPKAAPKKPPGPGKRKIRPEEPPANLGPQERKAYRMGHITDKITAEVERLTGLPSKWSGVVSIDPESARWWGVKQWSCLIGIKESIGDRISTRYPVLIHEVLHSVSNDMLPGSYVKFTGWEEGTVEGLQRIIRPDIMKRRFKDLDLEDTLFQAASDRNNAYNPWVNDLSAIADLLGIERRAFFLKMIGTPLEERPAVVRALGAAKFKRGTDEAKTWNAFIAKTDRHLRKRKAY